MKFGRASAESQLNDIDSGGKNEDASLGTW
jgi:hypothetical protein